LSWKDFNLVQRFSILSAIYICGLALALGFTITEFHEWNMIRNGASSLEELLDNLIQKQFPPEELTPLEFEKDIDKISRVFEPVLAMPEIVRIKVYNREGVIIWSDEGSLIGKQFPGPRIDQAIAGNRVTLILKPKGAEHIYEKDYEKVVEIYAPVLGRDGKAIGVLEIYQVPRSTWTMIHDIKILVWLVVAIGGGLLYIGL
jgi:hypothetical protein